MAVPTISTVSPAVGPAAGGNIIVITGTNFKIPTLVYTIPVPTNITPTVSVTVGGRAARRVDVISATQVRVLVPRMWHQDPRADAYSPVSIVLNNLDSNGNLIVGETVTKTSAYTYQRWVLGAPRQDSPVSRIAQELAWALMIEVERNTYMATHVDYGEEGSAVVIAEGNLPSINMQLSIEKDTEFGARDNYPEEILQNDGRYKIYEGARTVQLVADLLVAGGTLTEAMNLVQSVQDFAQVNPNLRCACDPTLYPNTEDDYPLEIWQDYRLATTPANSGLVAYSMQLRVRGITVLPDDPTLHVKTISTFTLTFNHLDHTTGLSDGVPQHTTL